MVDLLQPFVPYLSIARVCQGPDAESTDVAQIEQTEALGQSKGLKSLGLGTTFFLEGVVGFLES